MIDYLNVPEDMLDQPVEPWQPNFGDRVRVLPSIAECTLRTPHGESHFDVEVGRLGTVSLAGGSPEADACGHTFCVIWDDNIPDKDAPNGHGWYGSMYAACELEPLS